MLLSGKKRKEKWSSASCGESVKLKTGFARWSERAGAERLALASGACSVLKRCWQINKSYVILWVNDPRNTLRKQSQDPLASRLVASIVGDIDGSSIRNMCVAARRGNSRATVNPLQRPLRKNIVLGRRPAKVKPRPSWRHDEVNSGSGHGASVQTLWSSTQQPWHWLRIMTRRLR